MGCFIASLSTVSGPPKVRHPDCANLREADLSSVESQAFYPLTFPITAGPGCIVVMITLSAQASAQRGFADLEAHGGITLAVAALSAVVSVCYGFAPMIAARINRARRSARDPVRAVIHPRADYIVAVVQVHTAIMASSQCHRSSSKISPGNGCVSCSLKAS
jgi:small neutral amino acid transporter SnatA (MarC family)